MKFKQLKKEIANNYRNGKIISDNFVQIDSVSFSENQKQTKEAFSNKWKQFDYNSDEFTRYKRFHKNWFLELYGFSSEKELAAFLNRQKIIIDAGTGTGFKAAWFAELSPQTQVVAIDISTSLFSAAKNYQKLNNLLFIQADISQLDFIKENEIDFISCDQVIHHTSDPKKTLKELVRILKFEKELALYVYKKKALPRELLDDYFRDYSRELSHEELMDLSEQLTVLGKKLSELKIEINFPDIPLLGIKGGRQNLQRFVYWNFLKCFWNEENGFKNSQMINYDWYSPSQAFRYSKEEFKRMLQDNKLSTVFFHQEHACYSGRFTKKANNCC